MDASNAAEDNFSCLHLEMDVYRLYLDDGATVDDDDGIDAALMQLPIVTIKIESVLQLLSIVCSLESTLTFQ